MKGAAMQPIRKGSIATCSHGMLGLILVDEPVAMRYPDGNSDIAWIGIQLGKKMFGEPWSSRHPKVVSHINVEMHDLNHLRK